MIKSYTTRSLPRRRGRGRQTSFRTLLAILWLFVMYAISGAQTPQYKYLKLAGDGIQTEAVIPDSLPLELISYINKGIPISFEYRFELWHETPGWFDKLVSEAAVNLKIRYDTWEKRYSVVQLSKNLTVENDLTSEWEALELLCSSGSVILPTSDTSGAYYLYGTLIIRTMSFSNYKEVESWLKGGVSDVKKPQLQEAPDKVGEFVFNMAMKVSGLKNISREFNSGSFRLSELPLTKLKK